MLTADELGGLPPHWLGVNRSITPVLLSTMFERGPGEAMLIAATSGCLPLLSLA